MVDTIEAPAPEGSPKSGFSAGNSLGKMVGPLPLWGWGAAVLIGVAIVIWRRKSSGSSTPPQGSTYAQQAQIPTIGNAAGAGSSPTISGGEPAISNNNDWRTRAVRFLTGKGFGSLDSDTAIGKYLRSDSTTSQEKSLIDQAIAALGVPPQPPAPGQNAPETSTSTAYDPTPVYGVPTPGKVDAPKDAKIGAYFGLPGSGVAIDPNDPALGKWGAWQTGPYVSPPAGYRDWAIAQVNAALAKK